MIRCILGSSVFVVVVLVLPVGVAAVVESIRRCSSWAAVAVAVVRHCVDVG